MKRNGKISEMAAWLGDDAAVANDVLADYRMKYWLDADVADVAAKYGISRRAVRRILNEKEAG